MVKTAFQAGQPHPKQEDSVAKSVNPHIFREYDVRGLVDEDFDIETVELLGKGYGVYIRSFGYTGPLSAATTGKARRRSGRLVSGIVSTGCDVIDVGELPTPAFYFSLQEYGGGRPAC